MGGVKQRILEAAESLYTEDGAAGLSMRKVAKRANVSTMASYRHFENKRALLHHLQVRGFAVYASLQEAIPPSPDPWATVRESTRAYIRFALEHPEYFKIAFMATDELGELKGLTEKGRAVIEGTFQRPVAWLIAAGVPAEHAQAEVVRAWAVMHGLVALHLAHRLDFLQVDDFEAFAMAEMDRVCLEMRARYAL